MLVTSKYNPELVKAWEQERPRHELINTLYSQLRNAGYYVTNLTQLSIGELTLLSHYLYRLVQ